MFAIAGRKEDCRPNSFRLTLMLCFILSSCDYENDKPALVDRKKIEVTAASNKATEVQDIGTAEMLKDRSIMLNLSLAQDKMVGDATMTYKVDDPNYDYVLEHVGRLRPGQVVGVRPFPE